jgi:alkylation response protein AidB-like acyl-CoA dehydrogenase
VAADAQVLEDIDSFRQRAREWLVDNIPRLDGADPAMGLAKDEGERADRNLMLQHQLWEGGFGGLCYPKEYGGQGLPPEYQWAFNDETDGYEMPLLLNGGTLTIQGPTLLDFGTEEQKQKYLAPIIRGEQLWVQFLSEPTGGSDLAGVLTRATRDGDDFILNGSKIWSSNAFHGDYAICVARTNWEVSKHRGITVFIVKIHQPGIHVEQIKQVNGGTEFCQEYFDDVHIPAADVLGEVDNGWTVVTRLLFHERNAVGGASPYAVGVRRGQARGGRGDAFELARQTDQTDDRVVRQLVAEAHTLSVVQGQLNERVTLGINTGKLPEPAGSLMRLFTAVSHVRQVNIGLEIAGTRAVTWAPGSSTGRFGVNFLFRQGLCLGGGSNEMQRNIISERVLGMPRERSEDRDLPFNQVRHNAMPARRSGGP